MSLWIAAQIDQMLGRIKPNAVQAEPADINMRYRNDGTLRVTAKLTFRPADPLPEDAFCIADETGLVKPCKGLRETVGDSNSKQKGVTFLELVDLNDLDLDANGMLKIKTRFAVLRSGRDPVRSKKGVVMNYCPSCGEALMQLYFLAQKKKEAKGGKAEDPNEKLESAGEDEGEETVGSSGA